MPEKTLKIAAACLLDATGRLLIVRKRGTQMFILPGGKIEPDEAPLDALKRELHEELGLEMRSSSLQPLGHFYSRAANEPDHNVEADIFLGQLQDAITAKAEIEAFEWLVLDARHQYELAPLLREQVVPALLDQLIVTTERTRT